ncbi:allantoate amidohydrolase [Edaphobacter bradus]|uniref:allantoate amidohydrolase n=1 Tax=Edaphobacter bradus TaxID=2259016 RepID=UPI0021E09E0C|nr:allantoate amidohydrolase [Edaphobacter bradus]
MSASPSVGRGEEIVARCRQIAAFTEVPGEITRTFLSPPMRDVHTLLRQWMEAAGMRVGIDAAGNIRGLYPGTAPDSPRLLIGSHLDTVPNAGAFDGILGVVLGVAVVEQLNGAKLTFAIEVVGFSEEEGVRFGKPFLGSLALVGKLDAELLARPDADGVTVSEAITSFGLRVEDLAAAKFAPETFAYLEFHIEQGPVLEAESASLAVVDAIVGQSRFELTFTGQANHAGTTPMRLRHDALSAASEWIVSVEAHAQIVPGLVATVGKIHAEPGAGNVVPGRVTASLDVRHAVDATRNDAVTTLLQSAASAAARRGVELNSRLLLDQTIVPMDSRLTRLLHAAAQQAGYPSRMMSSGAGHDAMVMAPHIPSTMLFLRSPGGLSHHPDEAVLPEDIDAALATAMEFLALLRDDKNLLTDYHA